MTFPCDMTDEDKEAYHAKRHHDERLAAAKRFGLNVDEVAFYNRGICYDRVIVTTMRAAKKVAKSVKGDTVNGGFFDGTPLGGISMATFNGVKCFDVRC